LKPTIALTSLLSLVLSATACSVPFTTPQRPLEAGEVVAQGSLDLPGFGLLPRASGGLTLGTGGGDIGIHAGTSIATGHAGAHGRLYLAPVVVSLQGSVVSSLVSFELTGSDRLGFVTSTLRVGNLPRAHETTFVDNLYGGFELDGLLPFRELADTGAFDLGNEHFLALPGLYGGLERQLSNRLYLQAEASLRFLALGTDDDGFLAAPILWPQLGINLQYAF
jgi:hypothetical protein